MDERERWAQLRARVEGLRPRVVWVDEVDELAQASRCYPALWLDDGGEG